MYTLLYLKWITSKDLLYSTGNSAQCHVAAWMGEGFRGTMDTSMGFPDGFHGKASACNVGDPGSFPGSGRSPGEGNGNPLQHSCLENPMDRGA